ncbi:ABC transporter permease [Dactylosporangium sp. NPDC000521]|uniref:ABC transporter permease n=1 Tax=Dactylosporangium sp. NPDC000521 TaxID=3363975 RepID=UPI003674F0B1
MTQAVLGTNQAEVVPPGRRRRRNDQWGLVVFVARRLAILVLLLLLVSFAVFSLIYLAPGSPIDALLGPHPRTPEAVAALTERYHLDEPFLQQYWHWLGDAVRLDFGSSIQTSLPVTDEIGSRAPTTLLLGLYAFVLTLVLGVGLGILAALKQGSAADRSTVAGTVVALSTPTFVLAVFLLYLFSVRLGWFPAFGKGEGFLDGLWHLTLPALALALGGCAFVVKHTRSALIGVLDQDYIMFAKARGLAYRRVLFSYALKNALIPVITISGLIFSGLIIGAVLIEVIFSVQGLGQLLVQSARAKDLPVIQGVTLLTATLIMLTALVTDLVYMLVDPRIRVGA